MGNNNTRRNYPRHETMRNPAQNTQYNAPQGTQPTMPPERSGRTRTVPHQANPTVPYPANYGTTRPNMPPGVTQPSPSQPTQPMPRQYGQQQYGNNSGYSGSYAPIESPIPPNRQPQQAARARKSASVNPWLIAAVFGILGLGGALAIVVFIAFAALSPDRIPNGVRVAGFDIGGQNMEAARATIAQIPELQIALVDGSRSFQVRLSDLGGFIDTESTLNTVKDAVPNADVLPQLGIDLAQAQFGLVALTDTINITAIPGNPPQIGRSMEIPVMLDRLRADPTGELADGIFELNMIEIDPPPPLTGANADPNARTTHVVERGQELALIAREYGVTIDDIMFYNDISNPDLIYEGQALTIPASGAYIPANVPPAPLAQGKSIVVSTSEQRIYAYENGQLVRQHLTSTGLAATPTVLGDYRIYVKYQATDMSGPGYYLPQVPYTMYFYQGYGIHGTYWHNSFGRPMSHGCVNLPTPEAEWFFNWAEVGTMVRVI